MYIHGLYKKCILTIGPECENENNIYTLIPPNFVITIYLKWGVFPPVRRHNKLFQYLDAVVQTALPALLVKEQWAKNNTL